MGHPSLFGLNYFLVSGGTKLFPTSLVGGTDGTFANSIFGAGKTHDLATFKRRIVVVGFSMRVAPAGATDSIIIIDKADAEIARYVLGTNPLYNPRVYLPIPPSSGLGGKLSAGTGEIWVHWHFAEA